MEVTSLTSALKQVYNIHKNIVSDLNAKIDMLIVENKKLKSNNLKEDCLNCVQLKANTQRLQDHLASRLKEKESVIDQLKAQILSNNDSALLADKSDDGCEDRGACRSPSTDDSKTDSTAKDESSEVKHSSRLRLIRENKRRNRYQEEVPEMKRKKTVLDLSTLAATCHDQDKVTPGVLVPETENLEGLKDRSMLNVINGEDSRESSSQKILVVLETVDMDEFMDADDALAAKDLALEEPSNPDADPSPLKPAMCKPGVEVCQNLIDKIKTGRDVTFPESEPNQASFHKDTVNSNSKKMNRHGDESLRATFHGAGNGNKSICKKERSTLMSSERKTKSSEKTLSLQENLCELSQVFPGHTNKLKNCNVLDKRSIDNRSACPPSTIHADTKGPELQATREKMGTVIIGDERRHVPVLGTCDLNGSLNPDVHLSEFLVSQSSENLCLEKTKKRQSSAALDETVAPEMVFQLHSMNLGLNSRRNKSPAGSQFTASHSDSDSVKTVVNMFSAQQDGKRRHGTAGASPCLSDSVRFGKDRDSSDDEDDDEVVGSSPLHRLQVSSHLSNSIPSSFKFMPKNKQAHTHAFDVRTDRRCKEIHKSADANSMCADEKADYVDVDIKDDTAEDLLDMDRALEEIEKKTVDEAPDTVQSQADQVSEEVSLMDSFDRVPQICIQEVPHIQVVRKKSEKKKLEGYSCQECYQYYKNSGLTDDAMKQKMNECSRHRAKYLPTSTPDHFWTIGFPETSDDLRSPTHRQSDTPPINERNPRRRRRLEKRFKSRNEEETQK